MEKVIRSILPEDPTMESRKMLLDFFRDISMNGGLYQLKGVGTTAGRLKIENLRTVMVNYGYGPYKQMQTKETTKEDFLRKIVEKILERGSTASQEFDIRLDYDAHISSIGWSGSVPFKFVHRKTGQAQWITLQLRRGTIVHSGPNTEVMQRAINTLFQILF
jgi:hypothetical protein